MLTAVVAVLGFRRVHLADRRSTRSYSLTRSDYFVTRGSFWGISGVASVWGGYVGSGYGWRGGARGGGDRCSVGTKEWVREVSSLHRVLPRQETIGYSRIAEQNESSFD